MQSLPIYLYDNTLDVILDLDPDTLGVNEIMYQRELKIQKGIKNKIRIQFKNSDQKRLPISNTNTYVFNMFDTADQRLVLQKELVILDDTVVLYQNVDQSAAGNILTFADTSSISVGQTVFGFGIPVNTVIDNISGNTVTLNNSTTVAVTSSTSLTFNSLSNRGVGQLTFTESDTLDLEKSAYQFSITYQDPADGTYLPTYTNTYYGIPGTVYLNEDIFPTLQPSQEIISFLKSYNQATYLWEHKSGNIYAYPEYNSNTALHTMALYMGANGPFIGTVYIQGTLSNQPDSFGKYATIATLNYNGFTGIDYVNFNGVFTYVRIMYVPAIGPASSNNDDPSYYGSFDKVLYRS
jgi:hypothetical protein